MRAIINLAAFVFIVLAVHTLYAGYIRPEAGVYVEEAREAKKAIPRNFVIIMKDLEQEICVILFLWGSFYIVSSCLLIMKNRYLYNMDLVSFMEEKPNEDTYLDTERILTKLAEIPAMYQQTPLLHTLKIALHRYHTTTNVQNLSDAVESSLNTLSVRYDTENNMIRYLIWAIPSVGFIGTVRGIGEALSLADQALAGDISGMTNSLGVAFNSTLVALCISIILMLLYHQLQRLQDTEILATQQYCEKHLLGRVWRMPSPKRP
ncbi:MAG: MotA/TolQ/ExbB proton channel family protein [Candidatus Eutrophobiaceae bacterium]